MNQKALEERVGIMNFLQGEQMYQQFFFGEFRCKLEMESLWISSEKLKLKKCPLWGSVDRTVILWSLETFMSVPWLLLWEIGFPKDKAIVFFLEFL